MPARIGPYEIVAPLGAGGMAATYVAVRRGPAGFEQRVCLKRILPEFASSPEFKRQFSAEARIAAALRHTNIVQVLDFGEEQGTYFQALELIEGVDLRLLLKRARPARELTPALVAHCGIELAAALDYAHRATVEGRPGGVVHRDLSPSNVLLSIEGEVKLADFGIARSATGPHHTATGVIRGKVPYMAPEYVATGKFDRRADLFAFGVLLYECLAGGRPYDGPTDLETLRRAATGQRTSLAELAPTAPKLMVEMVERLIDPDPARRPATAVAVMDALAASSRPDGRRRLAALVRAHRDEVPGFRPLSGSKSRSVPSGAFAPRTSERGPAHAGPRAVTRTAALADASGPPAPHRGFSRRGTVLVVAAGLAATALGASYLLRTRATGGAPVVSSGQDKLAAAQTDPSTSISAASTDPIRPSRGAIPHVRAEPSASKREDDKQAEVRAQVSQRAQLSIVVLPFGEVHVDGRPLGAAPVSVSLSPGAHEVRVSGPGIEATRSILLGSGEKRRLVLP